MTVVGLDDLDVVAGGQRLGGHLQQLERDVHPHAHVGRHHDGNVFRGVGNGRLLRFGEAGGADDQVHAKAATGRQVLQRAFGAREVDQHLRARQAGRHVSGDDHPAGVAQKRRGIAAHGRTGGDVECTGQHAVAGRAHGLDQHVAHAAGRAGHRDAMGKRRQGRLQRPGPRGVGSGSWGKQAQRAAGSSGG